VSQCESQEHGVSFIVAQEAFYDPNRITAIDEMHSKKEERYFCIGKVSNRVLTVRCDQREKRIRIYGAGYWQKGKKYYDKENATN